MPLTYDPYAVPKSLGVYREIANHSYQNVNAGEIVERILRGREMYEARQRAKGEKAVGEEAVRRREREERDHAEREKRRKEIEGQWGL
jgi:ethanolamine-phosphate cytidylyltransferase